MRVEAPHFGLTAEPKGAYLYNGKENHEELGLNWLEYGARMYDPSIARFPSVDPIADEFAFVSGFNYAENSPIANIDLWGLQKYFSSNGDFIKQQGDDNSIRIVPERRRGHFETFTSSQTMLDSSTPAYSADQEERLLLEWAYENHPKSKNKEHSMSLFTKNLTDENGNTFKAIIPGTTAVGKDGSRTVDPYDSVAEADGVTLDWKRSTTIHTHPSWGQNEFSDTYDQLNAERTGDVAFALNENVNLYLVAPDRKIYEFSPARFNSRAIKSKHEGMIYNREDAKWFATAPVDFISPQGLGKQTKFRWKNVKK